MAGILSAKIRSNRKSLINLSLGLVLFLWAYSIFSFFNQSNTISQFTEEFLWQVNTGIQETTRNYLMPAQFISDLSSQLVSSGVISIADPNSLQSYIAPFTHAYPQLQSYYIGTENDEFWFWINEPKPGIDHAIRHIRPEGEAFAENWYYYDAGKTLVEHQQTTAVSYRPTHRPWYKGAKQVRSSFWTDVYIFNAKNRPGITSSHPIFNTEGKIIGAWGVDIAIQELSDFLADISVARLGEIAILNGDGSVIAYSGKRQYSGSKQVELISLEDLGSHALVTSFNSFKKHGFGYFFVDTGGLRFLSSVSPLTFPDEQNWQIVIAIPADALLGDLLLRLRINGFLIMLSLAFLVVFLVLIKWAPNRGSD